jgi:hypothetical protein
MTHLPGEVSPYFRNVSLYKIHPHVFDAITGARISETLFIRWTRRTCLFFSRKTEEKIAEAIDK